jgi:hypothetical protein
MIGYRDRALDSSVRSTRYASSASRLTRQTPLRPIFSAGSSPLRISVYTCETVTFSTPATSDGLSRGGGRSSTTRLLGEGGNVTLRRVASSSVPNPSIPSPRPSRFDVM